MRSYCSFPPLPLYSTTFSQAHHGHHPPMAMGPPGNFTFSYLRLQPLSCRRLRPIVASFPSSRSTIIPQPRVFHERDMKVDFGRYKGCRLGTLPPSYLKWLANSLDPTSELSYWSKYAKRVLEDPVYQDRVEWDHAARLFTGDVKGDFIYKSYGVMKAYREIGEGYGWDMDDKDAWSKVNLELIGTSFTGRIPRKKDKRFQLGGSESVKVEESERKSEILVGGKRGERIERMRLKREKVPVKTEQKGEEHKGEVVELGDLDNENCVKQGKRTGLSVGRTRGGRIERMRLRREMNVQMVKNDKVDEEILEEKVLEEKEEEVPRVTVKKERTSLRKRGLQKEKRELGVGMNDKMISFAKRVENSGNGEIFNPLPGRDALFEKIRSRKY